LTDIQKSEQHAPLIIPRSEHNVSRANIAKSALKVLYRLKDAGYQAFLVGGSVRDLLLGHRPKDFDVATDAHPEQVRALFGNSRLIGRRFRLAHVRFGREIIEVATFRGTGEEARAQQEVCEQSGRIISDNVYGLIDEDAWRRDFTVNALYYNIADYSIWDFTDGVADVRAKTLRLIGDADRRYREDPVRMMRAARFAAKLHFTIDPDSCGPIPEMAGLIDGVPAARLFDEFLKLFQAGYALAGYQQLRALGLFEHLFPATGEQLSGDADGRTARFIEAALANTDQRVAEGKAITPMFLFGVFLWHAVEDDANRLMNEESLSEFEALLIATTRACERQNQRITLPKRFGFPMREMLQLQPRFKTIKGKRAFNFLTHRRFRAAYDLMLLRAAVGDVDQHIADFWTEVQLQPDTEQKKTFGMGGRQRRSGHRSRRSASAP
jgi:poly(A) polymerase